MQTSPRAPEAVSPAAIHPRPALPGAAQRKRRAGAAGYTAIEMMGVLVVAAVLAGVVAESAIQKAKQASRTTEDQTLVYIGSSLQTNIVRSKCVPGLTNWSTAVATEMAASPSTVTLTPAGNNRLFFLDPTCNVGTNVSQQPPYSQSAVGSTVQPANLRVMVVSSLGPALPTLNPADFTTFTNLWYTPDDGVPNGWGSPWNGRGKDLKILRLDLGTLFNRVVLENLDNWRSAPYSIETTNNLTFIPPGGRVVAWYLDNTGINFHYNDGTLQGREYINQDVSYVYENGRWGRYLYYGKNKNTGLFGQWVDAYLAAPTPASPKFSSSQQAVVNSMFDYLYYFGMWATDSFPTSGNSALPQIPENRMSSDAQVQLGDFTYNLQN